jgi:hypothetical protein
MNAGQWHGGMTTLPTDQWLYRYRKRGFTGRKGRFSACTGRYAVYQGVPVATGPGPGLLAGTGGRIPACRAQDQYGAVLELQPSYSNSL